MATRDDYASSSEEDEIEEQANLYFMALEGEEELEVSSIELFDFFDLSYDELLEVFHELMHDSTLLAK